MEKAQRILAQQREFLSKPRVGVKTLESLIGRLLWLASLWHSLRPLLSPLYCVLAQLPSTCVAVSPELWGRIQHVVDDSCHLGRSLNHASFWKGVRLLRIGNKPVQSKHDILEAQVLKRRLWVTVHLESPSAFIKHQVSFFQGQEMPDGSL